jgi:hypothetical protein
VIDRVAMRHHWSVAIHQHRFAEYLLTSKCPVEAKEAINQLIVAVEKSAADRSSFGSNTLTAQAADHASRYALPRLAPHA